LIFAKMKKLVSILIPCYNADRWLAETIESALAQTWGNKEIIIVDDGSTDGSLAIAKIFESKNIKIITQPNQGSGAARNRALQEAQGDFIQYLDADDLLSPNKIKRQLDMLLNGNLDCVISGEWARFNHHPAEAIFLPQPIWTDLLSVDWLINVWQGHGMMLTHAWLIPRMIAQQAGQWNEALSLNDDGEYFTRIVLASRAVKFCRGAKAYYRSGNLSSLSASRSPQALESAFLALDLCTQHLLSAEDSARTRHACAASMQRFIYDVYPSMPELQKHAEAKVQEWGGCKIKPMGGLMFQLLSVFVGWKQAKQIQDTVYRYGYRKFAVGWRLQQALQKIIYFRRY
jgi:glycosyltransferase involved in cell wall biosynthesis